MSTDNGSGPKASTQDSYGNGGREPATEFNDLVQRALDKAGRTAPTGGEIVAALILPLAATGRKCAVDGAVVADDAIVFLVRRRRRPLAAGRPVQPRRWGRGARAGGDQQHHGGGRVMSVRPSRKPEVRRAIADALATYINGEASAEQKAMFADWSVMMHATLAQAIAFELTHEARPEKDRTVIDGRFKVMRARCQQNMLANPALAREVLARRKKRALAAASRQLQAASEAAS
jgi:hypothetical protein